MADAVLQFTIKAKDEASRVVRGATDSVKGDLKGLDTTVGRLAQSFGFSDSKAAALGKTLPVLGIAAGAVGAAVVGLGTAVFNLTKSASDAGSEIFEAGQKSNLSAEFLSALKVEAEQSGSSFEGATSKVVKWGNSLVDAARGNKDLIADLKRFGIDAAQAYRNPEAALKTFIETFNKLPPTAANNEAAMRLFKDRSGELIPVLRAFGTDYDGLVRKLDASGQIWTREATEKADEFGDALTELGQVASGIGNTFARELMPDITDSMKEISKEITKNKETFKEWGRALGDFIRGVRVVLDSEAGTIISWLARIAAMASPIIMLADATRRLGLESRSETPPVQNFGGFGPHGTPDFGGFGPHGKASPTTTPTAPADVVNETAAKEAASKREQARKAELRAIEKSEEEKVAIQRRSNEKVDQLIDANRRAIEEAQKKVKQDEQELRDLRADAWDKVRDALNEQHRLLVGLETELEKVNKIIKEAGVLGAIDARTAAWLRTLAVLNDIGPLIEKINRESDLSPEGLTRDIPFGKGQEKGPFVDPGAFTAEFGEPPAPTFDLWKSAVTGLKNLTVGSFKDMAGAMGAAAAAAISYGKSFGQAVKQAVGAAFAAIAAQAFVESLVNLAKGFAALAGFMPGSAALYFKSAALWGAAGIAAGAGAAAFSGGGGAASVAGPSSSPASGETERDRTVREGRRGGGSDPNEAQVVGYMMVDFKLDDNHVERKMIRVWKRMGEFRDTVMSGTVGTAPSY